MSHLQFRLPMLAGAILGAAVVLAACSSGSGHTGGSGGSNTAAVSASPTVSAVDSRSSTAAVNSAGSGGGTASGAAKIVIATETEFSIALSSKTLQPGTYKFEVKNSGKITHALTIDGPGVSNKSTGDISPGSTATLTVSLKAGSFEVYCPVGNHKAMGMDDTVKVA